MEQMKNKAYELMHSNKEEIRAKKQAGETFEELKGLSYIAAGVSLGFSQIGIIPYEIHKENVNELADIINGVEK